MDHDWSGEFNTLLSSPLGKELQSSLNARRGQLLGEAEEALDSEQKNLLNQAKGVRLALEHLQFRAILPKDEGSKASKIKRQ